MYKCPDRGAHAMVIGGQPRAGRGGAPEFCIMSIDLTLQGFEICIIANRLVDTSALLADAEKREKDVYTVLTTPLLQTAIQQSSNSTK